MSTAQLVFDTGPLLCFAAIPGGVKLFGDTYRGRGWTTYDVQRELRGLRSYYNPDIAAGEGRAEALPFLSESSK